MSITNRIKEGRVPDDEGESFHEERRRFPRLTEAQAFERAFIANPELAAAERREAYALMQAAGVTGTMNVR